MKDANYNENGIVVDWKFIKKEYDRLKCPKETHSPFSADFNKIGYAIDLSDRSRGKTTNKLLLGLLLYKYYGIVLQYIRQNSVMCELKNLKNLYTTVIEYGYIEKIFGDEYNDLTYKGRRWNLCLRGEDGKIVYQDPQHCTFCIGLNDSDMLKSTYNAPRGDMIFFDEFIATIYGYDDFTRFNDICKTIIRDRTTPIIFLSANTINKNSPWFNEFGIARQISKMEQGEKAYIKTKYGTQIFVEILGENKSIQRRKVNEKYFGFDNNKLASITGRGAWATDEYQHIPKDEIKILHNFVFILFNEKLIKLKLVMNENIGICIYVTPATKLHDDSIILTNGEIKNKNYIFGLGKGTFLEKYWKLFKENKFYYSDNETGDFLISYLSSIKQIRGI